MFKPGIAYCAFAVASAMVFAPAAAQAADYWVKPHSWLTDGDVNPVSVQENSDVFITLGTSSAFEADVASLHFEISYDATVATVEQTLTGGRWRKAVLDGKVDRFDAATGLNVLSFDEIIDTSFGAGDVAWDAADVIFRTGTRHASVAISRLSVTARDSLGNALPVTIGPDLHVEVLPEPASIGVLGIGAMALMARRRR